MLMGAVWAVVKLQRIGIDPPIVREPVKRAERGDALKTAAPPQAVFGALRSRNRPPRTGSRTSLRSERAMPRSLPIPAPTTAANDWVSRNRTVKYSSAINAGQEHRLGHGSGLQIQKIRIESEQAQATPARRRTNLQRAAWLRTERRRAITKQAEEGIAPARPLRHNAIDPHQRQHQQMRQRQPDRPNLIVARLARINDAPRDIEMRLGVAVIQSPARMIYIRGRQTADRGQRNEDQREFEPDLLQNLRFKTR